MMRFERGQPAPADNEAISQTLHDGSSSCTGLSDWTVETADGGEAEVGRGYDTARRFNYYTFNLKRSTKEMMGLLYAVAQAGDLVMVRMDNASTICVSAEQERNLPPVMENEPAPVVCQSAGELALLLERGLDDWMKWIDEVVRK
ncbi:MAG TPA: hypothetical protein VIL86_06500 [Tepidisphaeraceae bacterium]|jgi:hypothetical protein